MDAAFTAEQDEIRRTLRDLLTAHRPGPAGGTPVAPDGYDTALWHRLSRELGLPGLALPEEYGGGGRGPAELAVALEETGRALLSSPLLATAVLAAPLILALGTDEQRTALLPSLAAGELTAALAVPGGSLSTALGLTGDLTGGAWAGGGRAGGVQARPAGGDGGWRLYGEAAQVLDGHSAGLLLVAAHTGGFPRSRTLLFLVRTDGPQPPAGLVRTRQASLDVTRPLARIELRDTEAELLGADDAVDALAALTATGRTAAVALAAEAAGAAASALERTVDYVGERERSGRAVGSFQAVKLRLADLYVRVRSARSAAYYAAWDPESGGLALAQALEALRVTTAEAVQLHGGIGFTWEDEARLYFNRAASDELLLGPVHRLRDHAAQRAGLFGQEQAGGPAGRGPAGQVAV
ncbi:acyl-CoA/acyl-ACP dehydrogenase [Streptomyces poriferorum]|uniref:acyl-CoA dehydrogenase family protein n=1 Tax=Streptomyces poriferorum TaxID=2798799 RepID=UPI00273F3E54|nr:acyl-CoA dehydrogenase family protein [Streptomyces sp. Alt1]WLQ50196.1 acyl-CoA/acyl-ACP dehydrogenase [Streptomyces sp. Alt1]